MATRLPAQRVPPIGFAHRGARAHARENTLEAFLLARRLGATGLESDAWLTRDGVVVLDHDGEIGRFRRQPIAKLARDQLPDYIPTLADLYTACGTDYELSLDVKDPDAFDAIVEIAGQFRAQSRLWLCHWEWSVVSAWRDRAGECRLVDSCRLKTIKEGPERRMASLAAAGIDALNMHVSDWSGGLVALAHRFERFAFGWDAQHERQLRDLLDMGIDAVFSDYTDRMMTTISEFYP